MPAPQVSILITSYNVDRYIGATVDAALAQTCPGCEVIVVDDGSTDDTLAVLAGYGDRIRVVAQPNSGGPARPRNAGLALAQGEIVAICDGDDCLEPDSIAGAVAALEAVPQAGLVWGDFVFDDATGRRHGRRWSEDYTSFRAHLQPTPLADCWVLPAGPAFAQLLNGLFIGTSSVVARRRTLEQLGPFDETLPNGDDREMWLRLARSGADLVYRDHVSYRYRVLATSVSRRGFRRIPAMITVLERQQPFITDPAQQEAVRRRILSLRYAYAAGLRQAGQRQAACQAYYGLLSERFNLIGLRGLTRTLLGL